MNNLITAKKKAFFLLMAVFLGGLTGYTETASAASISGAGCLKDSCYGGTYELYYSGTGGSYDITYILNTVNLDHTQAGDYLNTVGFKVANTLTSISLTSAPGGISLWTAAVPDSSVNANEGCSTTGSGGFGCTEWIASTNNVGVPTGVAGAIYTFLFHITTNDPLFLDVNQASIKAVFADIDPGPNPDKLGTVKAQGLLSEGITLTQSCTSNCGGGGGGEGSVPEPDAIALIGIGLLGMGLSRKARS